MTFQYGSFIVYDESAHSGPSKVPYDRLWASKHWLTHYGNLRYLEFIAAHPDATFTEKAQARREIVLAQRKMDYWKRHPNWNQEEVANGKASVDRMWNAGKGAERTATEH